MHNIQINERMKFYRVPGISITVIDNYKIKWTGTYGFSDIEKKKNLTTKTLFQAASISKPVTAVAILKLVEEGLLKLNDDANKYLHNFKILNKKGDIVKVSIEELLSHTSGLNINEFPGYSIYEKIPSTLQTLKGVYPSKTKAVIKKYKTGSFNYSGGGYLILQKIIETITKQSFDKILNKEVLGPLNMDSSSFEQPFSNKYYDLAAGSKNNLNISGKYHIYPEKAAAGLWTTPSDLAKLVIEIQLSYMNRSNHILSQKTIKTMLTPTIRIHNNYGGLGFFLKTIGKETYFFHNGLNKGFQSRIIADLKNGYGLVVMTNSDNGFDLIDEVSFAIARQYNWNNLTDLNFNEFLI